jgi:hypothetical protein
MHVVFMPYGDSYCVERLLNDMKAQKHQLAFTSPDGKETRKLYMTAQLRILPFGFYEYVFPKEDLDVVLSTLIPEKPSDDYGLADLSFMGLKPLNVLRKVLKCEEIPEFKREEKMLWVKDNTSIQVIGIRADKQFTEPKLSSLPGWTHEAI